MRLYPFDPDEDLELLPLAARRALDHAGVRLSRESWRSLSRERRLGLVEQGSHAVVDVARVTELVQGASPPLEAVEPAGDPDPAAPPATLVERLGGPLPPGVWESLEAVDRWVLVKLLGARSPERFEAAVRHLLEPTRLSTHLGAGGAARMVDVGGKQESLRRAVAESRLLLSPEARERVARGDLPKGDLLAVARIAGIQGAKKTAELIPLCHPLPLTRVAVDVALEGEALSFRATAECVGRTGVEMEALTAASVAALAAYDMLKGVDRWMEIGPTRLLQKSGGRSGALRREAAS